MSNMPVQQLLLSWKDHNGAVVSVFENFLKKNTLVDCTLAAEGQYLKAHKVMLSACSSYFELLFSQESEKNPIVILKDVKFEELEAVVKFMYRGEVEVCKDRLAAFLEVADSLQIKGLGGDVKSQVSKVRAISVKSLSTNSILTQKFRIEYTNPGSEDCGPSSNVPADCDHIRNYGNPSVHESSERGSSPVCTVSTLSMESSCTVRKETCIDSESLENNGKSLALLSFNSGESEQSAENPIIKNEPEIDTFLEDQSKEEGKDFGEDISMVGDQDDCIDSNNDIMDIVLTNQQNIDAVWIQSDDQQNFSSVFLKEDHVTSASWKQEAVACGVLGSVNASESSAEEPAASADDSWIQPDVKENLSSVRLKEEPDTMAPWNQDAVAYDVSTSGDTVEPSTEKPAASAGMGILVAEDKEQPTSASVQFCPSLADSCRSSVSGKSTDASLQQTPPRMPSKKIFCPRCKEVFVEMMDLMRHLRSESCSALPSVPEGDPSLIESSRTQPLRLQRSDMRSSKRSFFKCSECNYVTSKHINLLKHVRIHAGEKPFKCTYCEYGSIKKYNLVSHLRRHMGEKPFQCSHCEFACKRKSSLVIHLRAHTGEKPFKCTHCEYACKRKSSLVIHLRTHTGEKPFKCTHCEYGSIKKDYLVSHLRTHTGEKPFQCSYCDYACTDKSNLVQHLRTHTGEKPFQCSHCDYACKRKRCLVRHLRTHTGEKPFKCTHCDYACGQKFNLVMHLRTHTGEKPFKCTHCDYACIARSNLVQHVRTHTGEKPFKCTHCDYRTTNKRNLVQHVRTHTGEKPFKCTHCEYGSIKKNHLVRHLRKHTDVKPFKCTHCENAFSSKWDLVQHLRTHTGKKPSNASIVTTRADRNSV